MSWRTNSNRRKKRRSDLLLTERKVAPPWAAMVEHRMNRSFDKEMQNIMQELGGKDEVPRLLLHSCCAPCSTVCLERLSEVFSVTVFYYNPNIYPEEEYRFRKAEQIEFIRRFPFRHPVSFLDADYDPQEFYAAVKGHERDPERGERCHICYRLRLKKTARAAAEGGFAYFTTTLTLSPLKDSRVLNAIGEEEAALMREALQTDLRWLPTDFKKRNGFLRSCEITSAYGMYRQDYCGCVYSLRNGTEHGD